LLAKLDQLIAKKRDLKQAAMQQLLSGEIRLPGFASQCRTVQLGDLGAWVGGATPSMKNAAYWTDGDVPWISSGDVTQPLPISALRLITRRAVLETATKVLPAGSLVLVTRSGILRHTLPIALVPSPVSINQDIKGLIPKTGVFGPFVLQALLESAPRILGACLKAGTTVESIEFRWLKRFPIRLPEESEQRAIAEVLCDMDTELVALEARRDKTRQLKQGMMQALLTGRIRLT
jgi:type I restriction enzyme S subunit